MIFDMLKLRRLSKRRNIPIKLPNPFMYCRVSGADVTEIALEMLDVDNVESDNGSVETNVCFCDVVAEVIGRGMGSEVGFGAV